MPTTLISVTTHIADTQMSLVSLHGSEGLSQPFDYEVHLLSTQSVADFTTVLGGNLAVTMTQPDGSSKQYLHGTIVEFAQQGTDMRPNTLYRARVRPAFWLLSMHSAYQTFQNKTVVQIIQAVFSAQGFTAFKNSLTKTYAALPYVVQYGETTLDFVHRLMEQAGIYYFFTHTASADTLVLADDASAHTDAPGNATLTFRNGDTDLLGVNGSIEQRLVPTAYKVYDYNFTTPATSLAATSGGSSATYQMQEYPGGYLTKSDGSAVAGLRLSALEAEAKVFHGTSRSSNLHAGYTFTLASHPRSDSNISWLILRMTCTIENDTYTNSFDAIPATAAFLPPRVTQKNRVHGTQTAIVTGKAGEEIWTDQYGRVTVSFPWDGTGTTDETSSPFVRVAQTWAGKSYGTLFTPRVGQEVVVSFLNGDPEQPLIVGTVYNAVQVTPYTLPTDQTKSTMKTYSSKGGQGFNEFRFEDKAGSEEVFLQAQKDLNVSVVKGDYAINVLAGKETHTVKTTRDITITGAETHTNSDDYTQSISGKGTITVTGDEKHTNSANFEQDVSGNFTLKVTGNLLIKATGSVDIESGTGFTAKAGTAMAVSGGTTNTVKAGTSMAVSGGMDTSVKAGTQLALEGSVTAELKGSAQTAIKGGIVQIN